MNFISKDTWFLKYLNNYPLWALYGGSLLALLISGFIFYQMINNTFYAWQKVYIQQINQILNKNKQLQQKQIEMNQLKKFFEADQKILQTKVKKIYSFDMRMLDLLKKLNETDVFLDSYIPSVIINKKWFEKKRVLYTLRGNFSNIFSLLKRIALSQASIVCKNITISSIENDLLTVNALMDFIQVYE
ncbi:MAG: hypothetical protein WDZ41_03025 [Candidatus Babeliales bacterium]